MNTINSLFCSPTRNLWPVNIWISASVWHSHLFWVWIHGTSHKCRMCNLNYEHLISWKTTGLLSLMWGRTGQKVKYLQLVLLLCLNFVFVFLSEAQLNRERVIHTVDSAVQGGDGRNFTPGLHQLPVRPVTQNGKHTTGAVATATSLANASGKGGIRANVWCSLRVW